LSASVLDPVRAVALEVHAPNQLAHVRLLTIREAAQALGFTEAKLRHLVTRGRVPVVHLGRRVYIPERDLENLTRPSVTAAMNVPRTEPPRVLKFKPRPRRRGEE
jgi:excisionase family DNA binding protein